LAKIVHDAPSRPIETTVINVKTSPWFDPKNNPNHVYIGRYNKKYGTSKWANPHHMKRDTDEERDRVIRLYRAHVIASGLINDVHELRGKILGCWCKPKKCHGDVLIDILNNYGAEERKDADT